MALPCLKSPRASVRPQDKKPRCSFWVSWVFRVFPLGAVFHQLTDWRLTSFPLYNHSVYRLAIRNAVRTCCLRIRAHTHTCARTQTLHTQTHMHANAHWDLHTHKHKHIGTHTHTHKHITHRFTDTHSFFLRFPRALLC